MDINQIINAHADQPLPHQLLMSWLKDYKRPNDKIKALKSKSALQALKKGLYIAGPSIGAAEKPDFMLLANHILGPSYVSVETALSYHGLIPERVYEVASMTTKASRTFKTAAGLFTYVRLSLPYYAFGLKSVRLLTNHHAVIASPEKALCDKIVTTPGLIRSINGAYRLQPFSFYVKCLALPDLFAGKMHALLFRKWGQNVKGRDWYDMEWYIKKGTAFNLNHFAIRAKDSGDWKKDTITEEESICIMQRLKLPDSGTVEKASKLSVELQLI